MVIVLAGYKSYLWDMSLARLERFVPTQMDVCLVSPALRSEPLEALAERRGWSYLSTRANYVSLAQNIAIARHPSARWIYKLDEDISVALDLANGRPSLREDGAESVRCTNPTIPLQGMAYLRCSVWMCREDDTSRVAIDPYVVSGSVNE